MGLLQNALKPQSSLVASASVSALGGVIPGSAILGSAGLANAVHTAPAALVAASSLKRERDDEDISVPVQSVTRTDTTSSSSALSEGAQQQPKKAKVEPSVGQ